MPEGKSAKEARLRDSEGLASEHASESHHRKPCDSQLQSIPPKQETCEVDQDMAESTSASVQTYYRAELLDIYRQQLPSKDVMPQFVDQLTQNYGDPLIVHLGVCKKYRVTPLAAAIEENRPKDKADAQQETACLHCNHQCGGVSHSDMVSHACLAMPADKDN